jgi:hypothetical protein
LGGGDIPQPVLAWEILRRDLLDDLKLIDFRFIDTTLGEYLLQSFWRDRNNGDISFNVDMYEARPSESTDALVEKILDGFNFRPQPIEGPGTKAYASKDRFTNVFVREQFAFLLRNTGKQPESTERFAKLIDGLITTMRESKRRS